jgi:hypothetical protein
MKTYSIYTPLLSYDETKHLLLNIQGILNEIFNEEILIVKYGWGCNIHNDLQYVPMQVGINWMNSFLNDSINRKIYEIGKSDLYFENQNKTIEVLFCHESDIHLTANIKEEIIRIKEIEELKKYLSKSEIKENEEQKKG